MENNKPSTDNFDKKFFFLCGGFALTILYAFMLTFRTFPKEHENIAYLILGVLLASCVKDAYSYLFGSTASSQAKDAAAKDTTDSLVKQLGASAPIPPAQQPEQGIPPRLDSNIGATQSNG